MHIRLRQHNEGNGSFGTQIEALRPWALMAYVVGFLSKEERLSFESRWKLTAIRSNTNIASAEQVFLSGKRLLQSWKDREADDGETERTVIRSNHLRLIRCGYVITTRNKDRRVN